jgi:hypothetical protein
VLKQIDTNKLNEKDKAEAIKEEKIHNNLAHPFIIKLIEVFQDHK